MKKYRVCQSCAMPLKKNNLDLRGTENDYTKSKEYCYHCLHRGDYVQPYLFFEEMVERGNHIIEGNVSNSLICKVLKFLYPIKLSKTKRWRHCLRNSLK